MMTSATLGDSGISVCRRFLADGSEPIREGGSVPLVLACGIEGSLCAEGSVVAMSVYYNKNNVK